MSGSRSTCASRISIRTGADWVAEDQQAAGLARIVDPERTTMGSRGVQFWDVKHVGRRAYQWVAEIDVLLAPGVPPLIVGLQQASLHARAYYLYEIAASMATLRVLELAPVIEFDAGVLLVHGIGMQRRSEHYRSGARRSRAGSPHG